MSNVPQNRVRFPKPDGYDEQRYEVLLRNYEAGDQRKPPTLDQAFASVGTFTFESDTPASVTISNADTDGHVIVDAVQFVPVK